jgi:hypothetical protein
MNVKTQNLGATQIPIQNSKYPSQEYGYNQDDEDDDDGNPPVM